MHPFLHSCYHQASEISHKDKTCCIGNTGHIGHLGDTGGRHVHAVLPLQANPASCTLIRTISFKSSSHIVLRIHVTIKPLKFFHKGFCSNACLIGNAVRIGLLRGIGGSHTVIPLDCHSAFCALVNNIT